MTNIEMEKELLANGFTEKEVNRLKKVLTHKHVNDAGGETLESLILDLKKGFIPSCIVIGIIPLLYPLIVTEPIRIGVIAFSVVAMILLFSVNLINPIKLSYKSYVFLKKKNRNEGE
ncbi:hypothetical protein [Yersinia mollaretii]|uniref:hypothetical protein n=1 Tax=Yersinia mollaretii TaxID=33060 RepID=UPI001FCB5B5A|nr:hypothetical protein [Yersinia mollaretii]